MSKFQLLTTLTLLSASAIAATSQVQDLDVIYGADNRKDIFEVSSPLHKRLALSIAGMVHVARFRKGAAEGLFDLADTKTLERGQNICPNEKFSQQPLAPFCSGFLVGPDLLVTAGHCYLARGTAEENCKNAAWVFDYNMKSASSDPTKNIPAANVFTCKQVVASSFNGTADYAIIRLNRPVTGRPVLSFRESGTVPSATELVVIGHPTGLPTKVSDKGKITMNSLPNTFSTTLDTFHGNSGSAVFDAKTGTVEGILIQGKTDYIPSKRGVPTSCKVMNVCDDNAMNCTAGNEQGPIAKGEVVLRMTVIANLIKQAKK